MPLPPLVSVDLHGAAWFAEGETDPAPLGGLRGAVLVGGHFEFGVAADVGVYEEADSPAVDLRPAVDVRWLHGDVARRRASAWVGVVGDFHLRTTAPAVGPTFGVEVPLGPVLGRLGADLRFGEQQEAAVVLGFGWRKSPPPPPVAVAPPPPPLPAARSGVRVWIPHPTCLWMPIEDAGEALAKLPAGTKVRVSGPGAALQTVDAAEAPRVELRPMPQQGGLTVAGAAGDQVKIAGQRVALGEADSTSSLAPEGVLRIEVTGGGRHLADAVVVTAGHALWVNLPLPEPQEIRFKLGTSNLDEAARAALADVVTYAGAWAFVVSGSASPEGEAAANEALAQARAVAVRDALVAAGLPADRVRLAPPHAPDPALPLEAQRTARITPVAP